MTSKIALLAALAVAAGGAAPAGAADKPQPAGKSTSQCFYTRMIDGFAAADQENLYVRVGSRDVYHFTMFAPCLDLDWNQRIALQSRSGGFICNALDVDVINHATGLGRQRCAVRSMEKLTPEQVAALPKRAKP